MKWDEPSVLQLSVQPVKTTSSSDCQKSRAHCGTCQMGVSAETSLVFTGRTQDPQQRGQDRQASRTFLRGCALEARGESCSTQLAMGRGQLHRHIEQLHPESIVSFPVCLTDSEQKGCLVLGAICIMFRQQWCVVSPWCLCSAPSWPPGT